MEGRAMGKNGVEKLSFRLGLSDCPVSIHKVAVGAALAVGVLEYD